MFDKLIEAHLRHTLKYSFTEAWIIAIVLFSCLQSNKQNSRYVTPSLFWYFHRYFISNSFWRHSFKTSKILFGTLCIVKFFISIVVRQCFIILYKWSREFTATGSSQTIFCARMEFCCTWSSQHAWSLGLLFCNLYPWNIGLFC